MSVATMQPPAVNTRTSALRTLLFKEELSTYAVIDGAAVPGLLDVLSAAPEEHACLFRGDLAPDLLARAPYLVKLRRESPFTEWLLNEQWGRNGGIFALTPIGPEALRRHFRTFLRVREPGGNVLYFRWYDPRVLRVYLPTCNAAETKAVFGPVTQFVSESEEADVALVFDSRRVRVGMQSVNLSEGPAVPTTVA